MTSSTLICEGFNVGRVEGNLDFIVECFDRVVDPSIDLLLSLLSSGCFVSVLTDILPLAGPPILVVTEDALIDKALGDHSKLLVPLHFHHIGSRGLVSIGLLSRSYLLTQLIVSLHDQILSGLGEASDSRVSHASFVSFSVNVHCVARRVLALRTVRQLGHWRLWDSAFAPNIVPADVLSIGVHAFLCRAPRSF